MGHGGPVPELLEPLRAMASRLPRLRSFSVALEYMVVYLLRPMSATAGEIEAMGALGTDDRWKWSMWYPFDAPVEERGRPGTGFWIKTGPSMEMLAREENRLLYDVVCCPSCDGGCTVSGHRALI